MGGLRAGVLEERTRWTMHLPAPLLALLTTTSLVVPLAAQKTWVVDAANGAGTDFRDLPPALLAASDGDTILVRSGAYTPGSTSKGLSVLGEPGAQLRSQLGPFTVAGLPRGRTFVMTGFANLGTTAGRAFIQLTNNPGRIHLDRLTLSAAVAPDVSAGVAVDRSECVTLTDCVIHAQPALHCTASRLAVTGSSLRGMSMFIWNGHIPFGPWPGVQASQSVLSLSRTSVSGGDGGAGFPGNIPGSPAAVLVGGEARVAGDAASVLAAGNCPGTTAAVAVYTDDVALTLDPSVTLNPKGGAPPIGGVPRALVWKRIPALLASGAPPGGSVPTDLFAERGDIAVLFAGAPGDPISLPFGQLWLDPALSVILDVGFVDQSQHRSVSVGVPNDPLLRGVAVGFQALTGPATPSWLVLSTPVVVALH
jgi:hypothetical protein